MVFGAGSLLLMCQKSFLRCSSIFCGLWLLASLCWEIKIFHHGGHRGAQGKSFALSW